MAPAGTGWPTCACTFWSTPLTGAWKVRVAIPPALGSPAILRSSSRRASAACSAVSATSYCAWASISEAWGISFWRTASSARSSAVWAILSCSCAVLTWPSASFSSGAMRGAGLGREDRPDHEDRLPLLDLPSPAAGPAPAGRLDRPQERRGHADQPARRDHRLAAVADRPRHRLPLRLDGHHPQPLLRLLGQLQLGQVRLLDRAGHLRRSRLGLRGEPRESLRGRRRSADGWQPAIRPQAITSAEAAASTPPHPARRSPDSRGLMAGAPSRPGRDSFEKTPTPIPGARGDGPQDPPRRPRSIYHDESRRGSHGPDARHEGEFRIRPPPTTELSQSPCRKPAPLDDKPGRLVMPGKGPGRPWRLACSDRAAPGRMRDGPERHSHGWDPPDSDRAGGPAAGGARDSAAARPAAMIRPAHGRRPAASGRRDASNPAPASFGGIRSPDGLQRRPAPAGPGSPAADQRGPGRPRPRASADRLVGRPAVALDLVDARPAGVAGDDGRRPGAPDAAACDRRRRRRAAGRRRRRCGGRRPAPGHDGGPAAARRGSAQPAPPRDAPGRQRRRAGRPVDHPATGPLRRPDQQPRPGRPATGQPARPLGRGRRGRPPLPRHAQPDRLGRLPADHPDPPRHLRHHAARAAPAAGRHHGGGFYHFGQNYILFSVRQPIELGHQTTHRYHIAKAAFEQQQWTVAPGRADDAGADLPLLPDGGLPPREVPPGPAARRLQRPARRVAPPPARGRPGERHRRRRGAGAGREPGDAAGDQGGAGRIT